MLPLLLCFAVPVGLAIVMVGIWDKNELAGKICFSPLFCMIVASIIFGVSLI